MGKIVFIVVRLLAEAIPFLFLWFRRPKTEGYLTVDIVEDSPWLGPSLGLGMRLWQWTIRVVEEDEIVPDAVLRSKLFSTKEQAETDAARWVKQLGITLHKKERQQDEDNRSP